VFVNDDYRPYAQILGESDRQIDRRQELALYADAYLPSCSSQLVRSGFSYSWKISEGGVDLIINGLSSTSSIFTIKAGVLAAYKVYDISLTVTALKSGRAITNSIHVSVTSSVTANIKGIDI